MIVRVFLSLEVEQIDLDVVFRFGCFTFLLFAFLFFFLFVFLIVFRLIVCYSVVLSLLCKICILSDVNVRIIFQIRMGC